MFGLYIFLVLGIIAFGLAGLLHISRDHDDAPLSIRKGR